MSEHFVNRGPSISLEGARAIVANSPLAADMDAAYAYCAAHGADPAHMLAHATKETQCGTQGVGRVPQRCAFALEYRRWERAHDHGTRFGWYDSYLDAAKDWVDLITGPVYFGAGLVTVETILPKYCEGDTRQYQQEVIDMMALWASTYPVTPTAATPDPAPVDVGALAQQVAYLGAAVQDLQAKLAQQAAYFGQAIEDLENRVKALEGKNG